MKGSQILKQHSEEKKECVNCGAELTYLPGSAFVACEYCGHKEKIQHPEQEFEELDLLPYLEKVGTQAHSQKISMIQCKKCGANQHIAENFKSLHCVYCSSPLLVEDTTTEDWILPGAIIPFQINKNQSRQIFARWVKNLWFAPNKLKKAVLDVQKNKGLYLPYWTFDAQLHGTYRGKRGEYYYVTVPYTVTENGKTVRRTRQERRTRWYSTNGRIGGFIDDTLVKASYRQKNRIPPQVSQWDLAKLEKFKSEYLSGFITEKYTIPLKDGHLKSVKEAEKIAHFWAKKDIGGDIQQVDALDYQLSEQTFKHILLPVYISSYQYHAKTYHFYINGQTGAIYGKRPYSVWKIAALVALVLLFILLMFALYE